MTFIKQEFENTSFLKEIKTEPVDSFDCDCDNKGNIEHFIQPSTSSANECDLASCNIKEEHADPSLDFGVYMDTDEIKTEPIDDTWTSKLINGGASSYVPQNPTFFGSLVEKIAKNELNTDSSANTEGK